MDDDTRTADLERAARLVGEAWANGDAATLDGLLSPTYTHTDVLGGFLTRAEWLEYAGKRAGRANQIAFRDVRTRIIGDVAIMTGVNEVRGSGARTVADRNDLVLRFTQIWIWRDGRWLREAFQATSVSSEQAS